MSFHPAVKPLMQPVRPAMVLHHLGQIALILAVLFAVPLAFAAATGDWELARRILLAALLPALALGACARIRPSDRPLQANEALVITALTFIVAAALMTYPLTAEGLSPLDAWFESVSGVTTTGLSLVPIPELRSDAFLFTRAWMQWFGGLGIVVLSSPWPSGGPRTCVVWPMRGRTRTAWPKGRGSTPDVPLRSMCCSRSPA
jgi:trk system potassium uptake protein